jgi:exodeoxyribonuclease VII large subunit
LQPAPDVIVVTRGGGSMEDLWCFNDEAVVRAVFQSSVPVVSAIGHEIDVTLTDLAADCRALTPSEAAERVIPSAEEWRQRLGQFASRLATLVNGQLRHWRMRLVHLASRPVMARPMDRILERAERLDQLDERLQRGLRSQLDRFRERTQSAFLRLEGLSPLSVLARGYSVTIHAESGKTVRDADALRSGDRLTTRLSKGVISSIVE